MDKLKGYMKSVTQKKYLPFWVFAVVMGIYHVIMQIGRAVQQESETVTRSRMPSSA